MKKRFKYPSYLLAALLAVSSVAGCQVYRNIGALPDEARFAHLPYYQNGEFVNLHGMGQPYYPEKATGEGGWLRHDAYVPQQKLPMTTLTRESFGAPESFAYYWLGHSSAILELNQQRILIDPVFDNAAPLNWSFVVPRIQETPIERTQLPPIDVVLITHDHYDHLEAKTIRYLADKVNRFIVPLGVGARLQSWGVPAEKITELGWGDDVQQAGIRFIAEPALHYSARWRNDRNKTLWAAFVLEGAGKRLYWGGDTGYGKHFAEAQQKYGAFDLAFIEIDAANPGWPNTHIFPEQAVQAAKDLNAQRMIPIHWGVFSLGRNPWDQSIKLAHSEALSQNLALDMPKMGDKYTPDTHQADNWWESIQ